MEKIHRSFNRSPQELRPISLEVNVNCHAEGSCLVSAGNTKVYCTASVEEKVPHFLKGQGKGWVSAEYSLLPRSTNVRNRRERDKASARSLEIQRLIGRALRIAVDFDQLGERTILLDCDVLQADGGTRTASVVGAYVALVIAIRKLQKSKKIPPHHKPLVESIGAISVGIDKDGNCLLDLDYEEDSQCEVDMNVVATGKGHFVEIQGTGEKSAFPPEKLTEMTNLALVGIQKILPLQEEAIERALSEEL